MKKASHEVSGYGDFLKKFFLLSVEKFFPIEMRDETPWDFVKVSRHIKSLSNRDQINFKNII